MNRPFPIGRRKISNTHMQKSFTSPKNDIMGKSIPKNVKRSYKFAINTMDNRLQAIPNIDPLVNIFVECFRVYDHGWYRSHLDLSRYFPSSGKELYNPSASILISFYHEQFEVEGLLESVAELKCINNIIIYPHTIDAVESAYKFKDLLQEHLGHGIVNIRMLIDTSFPHLLNIIEPGSTDFLIKCDGRISDEKISEKFGLINAFDISLNKPSLFIHFEQPLLQYLHSFLNHPNNLFQVVVICNFKLYNESEIENYFYNKGYITSDHRDINFDEEIDMVKKAELINKRIKDLKEGKKAPIIKQPSESEQKMTTPISANPPQYKNIIPTQTTIQNPQNITQQNNHPSTNLSIPFGSQKRKMEDLISLSSYKKNKVDEDDDEDISSDGVE